MPRLTNRPPKLCHHKALGLAMVYVNGKARYLGKHGSAEATKAYKQFVSEWATGAAPVAPADVVPITAPRALTIAEAVIQYKAHAERYYQSREVDNLGEAIKPMRVKFGFMPVADFGPLQLRTLRNHWIEQGLARNTINARVIRLKRFFRWACSYELIETSVLDRLNTVESLMPGRGGKETRPKQPVTWEKVEATLPFLPEMVRAMVLFAWHCGARPAEVTRLTTDDVRGAKHYPTGEVWVVEIERHKTALYGHVRQILVNRSAQAILTPWLREDATEKPIFSPLRVDDRQLKRKGKRLPGETYSRAAFQQVVRRACRRAYPHPTLATISKKMLTADQKAELQEWDAAHAWSPNLLRHAFGERLCDIGGLEASQMAMGHSKPDTTLIYAGAAKKRAMEAVREMGTIKETAD
jgi:integrase